MPTPNEPRAENTPSEISVSIVCPLYNEEEAIGPFMHRLQPVLEGIEQSFELIFVDDGCTDGTLAALIAMKEKQPCIRIVSLSRNFGKEAALTAGIEHARGDAVIPIDADLQDPPELIPEMLERRRQGYDVVIARRVDRESDTFIKRLSANWFYRLHNRISKLTVPENVGDFRLMSRKVVDALKLLPENQRFMKGIFAWVGFRTVTIDYVREERVAGGSKFNAWSLWNFALEGITSFSTAPLRVWLYIGLFVSMVAFAYGALIILRTLILGVDVPGYASLLISVLFLGGIQLVSIGVMGEYIGRIYMEVKSRPSYILDREI